MKFRLLIMILIMVLILQSIVLSEKEIEETINVDAWTIPLFAVDSNNLPITNLKKNDINLIVNGKRVNNFFLDKIESKISGINKGGNNSKSIIDPGIDKRTIVLLFDTATAESTALMRLKSISEKIILNSITGSKFLIMAIKPYKGLTYIDGPLKSKSKAIEIIKKKIVPRRNLRNIKDLIDDVYSAGIPEDMTEAEIAMVRQKLGKGAMQKNASFAGAFKDLNLALNSISGLKFIYLLSQGISSGIGMPSNLYGSMAKSIIKSGGVFFIINPRHSGSGEKFLKMVAKLSGGRYLSGSQTSIRKRVENIRNSYYEIGFQLPDNITYKSLTINITSEHENINLISIRSLKRKKAFEELSNSEQKLLILNLITSSNLFDVKIKYKKISISASNRTEKDTSYSCYLPEKLLNNNISLFKVYLDKDNKNFSFERSMFKPESQFFDVKFNNNKPGEHYFVFLNSEEETAYVKGLDIPEIQIKDVSIEKGILSFSISDFLKTDNEKGSHGYVKASISFIDKNNAKIYEKEKYFVIDEQVMKLSIPYSKFLSKLTDIRISATDIFTEKTSRVFLPVRKQ